MTSELFDVRWSRLQHEYVLIDKFTGELAMLVHQDGMKSHVAGSTIEQLIYVAADWADISVSDCLAELVGEPDRLNYYCLANYRVVVREARLRDLSSQELAEFGRVRLQEEGGAKG